MLLNLSINDFLVRITEKKYEKLLELSPMNKNLLRQYASFLVYIKNDPEAANYYMDLAKDLEESEERKRKGELEYVQQATNIGNSRTELIVGSVQRMRQVQWAENGNVIEKTSSITGEPGLEASHASLRDALSVVKKGSFMALAENTETLIVPAIRNAQILLGRRGSSASTNDAAQAYNRASRSLLNSSKPSQEALAAKEEVRKPANIMYSPEASEHGDESPGQGKPVVKPNHERRRGHDGSTTSGSSTSKEARQRKLNRVQLEGRLARAAIGMTMLF